MFTTSKNLMITAATLIPLALLAPTAASAFGLGGFGHMAPMSRGGAVGGGSFAHMSAMNRGPMGGSFAHTSGLNHARGPMGSSFAHTGATRSTSGATRFNKAGGSDVVRKSGATHAGNNVQHPATTGLNRDGHKPQTLSGDAKRPGNDSRTTADDRGHAYTNREDRVHGPTVYVPGLPGFNPPVFTDGPPKLPDRPVFAEGGNGTSTRGNASVPGPDADTPSDIVTVERPCNGAILRVSSARSECLGGFVHITGENFYYCPSKNRFEMRRYDYWPTNAGKKIACGATDPGLPYPPPEGWVTIDGPNLLANSCHRKDPPEYVYQWVAGPQYWELQTWEVYECTDTSGNQVDRLFRTPDVTGGGRTLSSDPVPVTPDSLRGGNK